MKNKYFGEGFEIYGANKNDLQPRQLRVKHEGETSFGKAFGWFLLLLVLLGIFLFY